MSVMSVMSVMFKAWTRWWSWTERSSWVLSESTRDLRSVLALGSLQHFQSRFLLRVGLRKISSKKFSFWKACLILPLFDDDGKVRGKTRKNVIWWKNRKRAKWDLDWPRWIQRWPLGVAGLSPLLSHFMLSSVATLYTFCICFCEFVFVSCVFVFVFFYLYLCLMFPRY